MLDLERIASGEDVDLEDIEYQPYDAKSTTSDKKGTLYEFTITTLRGEIYTLRVIKYETGEDAGSVIFVSCENNTRGAHDNILEELSMDSEEFIEGLLEWITSIIDEIE